MDDNFSHAVSRRVAIGGALIAVGALSIGAAITNQQQHNAETNKLPRDLAGNPVAATPEDTPSPSEIPLMDITPVSARLVIPSVALDVPLKSMKVVGNTIKPPTFTDAYVVNSPAHTVTIDNPQAGRLIIAMHSVQAGHAPGNDVIDVASGRSTLHEGDSITVGKTTYQVFQVRNIDKGNLAQDSEVWVDTPNTLALITCLQRVKGRSLSNVVILATSSTTKRLPA